MEEQIVMPEFRNGPAFLEDNFEYGTTTPDTAIEFMVKAGLSGYEFLESDFVTIVPNASVGTAVRIHGESYDHDSALLGANETVRMDEPNRYNAQRTRRRKHSAYLRVRRVSSHRSFSYANIMGSWKAASLLDRGMFEKWKSRALTLYFYNRVLLNPVRRQIADLSVNGDYKSTFKAVSQVDGAFKQLAYAGDGKVMHEIIYDIPELANGQHIHILASGKKLSVSKQTDLNAQLAEMVTKVNAVTWKNRSTGTTDQLFEAEIVTVDDVKYLRVVSKEHKRNVEFKIAKTDSDSIDWKKMRGSEIFGGVKIKEEKQGNLTESPRTIDYLTNDQLKQANRDTRYNTLIDWFMAYSEEMDFYDDLEGISRKDVITYLSPFMNRSLNRALLWSKNNFRGAASEFEEALGMNKRIHPRLHGSETFTAARGNLHIGVDQMSDVSKVSTHYDWKEEEILSKIDGAIGFQWVMPGEVVTNASHVKNDFQPLDLYLDQFADVQRIDLAQFEKYYKLTAKN